jgi:hypothetical protein
LWDTQRYVSMKFIQMEEYTYNVIELWLYSWNFRIEIVTTSVLYYQ